MYIYMSIHTKIAPAVFRKQCRVQKKPGFLMYHGCRLQKDSPGRFRWLAVADPIWLWLASSVGGWLASSSSSSSSPVEFQMWLI